METLTFYTLRDLEALDVAALENLWELVPTARQKHYQDRLSQEVHLHGAQGADDTELMIVQALLDRYGQDALVPVGSRWVKAPRRVREAAESGTPLVAPEAVQPSGRPALQPLLLLGGGALVFLCFFAFVLLRGGSSAESHVEANVTSGPRRTATPTPIALVESDAVIREGDRDRALAYPIGLQVYTAEQSQPRVFIVQRRQVEIAEWHYDPNPDTASLLSDLAVRKIIGIPYSRDNAALFDAMTPGTEFMLRLNTGGELRFTFEQKVQIQRSDTTLFRQVEPGLVLVLIGETGNDGLPTGQRWVISARYLADQELTREGVLAVEGLPTPVPTEQLMPTHTPVPVDPKIQLHIALIGHGVETHAATNRLTVYVRIYNDQDVPVTLGPEDFRLALGYAPNPPGPWVIADGLELFTLEPGQAVDLLLYWPWQGERYLTVEVCASVFTAVLMDR